MSSQRNPPLRVDVAFRNVKCRFSDIAIVNAIYNLLESCCYRISHLRSVLLLHPFLQIIFSRYSPLDSSTLRSASIVAYSALTVDLLLPRWLESYPFSSYCLLHSLLTYDIFVVDRYSDFAISLTITNEVGELDGDVGIDAINIVGVDDIVGTVDIVGVPILKNAIGDVAIPHIGIGDVTVINRGITLTWRSPEVE